MPHTRTTRCKTSARRPAKERITVSLSTEKVRFLKAYSGQKGTPSVSAYAERLIADAQARTELEELSAHTAVTTPGQNEMSRIKHWGVRDIEATKHHAALTLRGLLNV